MSCLVKVGFCILFIMVAFMMLAYVIWYNHFRKESFSETVLRRCSKYIRDPKTQLSDKNCTKIQEAFRNAFISKHPCHITEQAYQPLMSLVDQAIPCDTVLFWSKTKTLAREYAEKQDLLRLEDTLPGYMADGLTWCSAPGSADVKTKSCPERNQTCYGTAKSVFWDVASKWFAGKACGEVEVVFSGSVLNAFNSSSTFARVTVPYLKTGVVRRLHAVLIHERREQVRDSCSGSSIKNLELILNRKNIAFTCQEIRADELR